MPQRPGNQPPELSVQHGQAAGAGSVDNPRVYLVGAGPGDPELLTVRAARLLDVVVRLKGGDPFLFGRGGEEAQALLDAGVAFEVVPGVSSALAGPAAAGIPVTHRRLAASVTIVTGHEGAGELEKMRWDALVTASDTLVVLMGAGRLTQLSRRIIAAGRPPSTPAAVVMAASRPEQRQAVATLADISRATRAAGIGPPAILVIGEVVALAESLGRAGIRELAAEVAAL